MKGCSRSREEASPAAQGESRACLEPHTMTHTKIEVQYTIHTFRGIGELMTASQSSGMSCVMTCGGREGGGGN